MPKDIEKSLSDDATFDGSSKRRAVDASLGDERTLGDGLVGQDTVIDDMEVVDLALRYRIEGTLGQGGMGEVLLAVDTRLDRKVAIKRILGETAGNRTAVNRFLTEAKSIAALNHPNIVQIYDYGRAKDGPFLIMEYVDGGSLLDRCRESALPLDEAIALACQLCDGLAKAHDLGIIHRDIKPANVLLTKDGTPKLTDFGLAKTTASDHGQTMTGAVLGTPDFMPPEQRRDASLVDHRSDLWSLAATIYQMITGRSPKVIQLRGLPEAMQDVLGKALEEDKDSRYRAAREFREALKGSLRASATKTLDLDTGQCPACGAGNETSRKFCRKCGGSLVAPCLACSQPMLMWEEVCGDCGAKQTPLVDASRAQIAALQAKAEGLLGDFEFDKAAEAVKVLCDEPHARLGFWKTWAEEFRAEVERSRDQQVSRVAELLAESLKHEQAHDYLSAGFVLDAVPLTLRQTICRRHGETVEAALRRVQGKQEECRCLQARIKERIARKDFAVLEADVDKLLALQPQRPDLVKLKSQLTDMQRRLVQERDAAMAQSREWLAKHNYKAALAAIEKVRPSVSTTEVSQLQRQCEELIDECRRLREQIRSGMTANRFEGLLRLVERLLALVPGDPERSRYGLCFLPTSSESST